MQEILSERPNLFEPNDYITFYVRIAGCTGAEDLVSAVQTAYGANESTSSKIVLKADGTACYEKLPQSGCKVEIINENWQEIVRKNERIPFNLKDGELVRSFVISDKSECSLLIMAHHLVGDGKAIVYFIECVMRALSGEELEYRHLSMLTKSTLLEDGKLPFFIRNYMEHYNRKWKAMGNRIFTWEDYDRLHRHYWKNNTSEIQYKTFSISETAAIREKARQIGVSVNSYLVTAFLQADKKNRIVGIPVSVRETGNKSMTNLTSGISITHRFSDKHTFEENAKRVHRKIQKAVKKNRLFVLQFVSGFLPAVVDGILLSTHDCVENPLLKRLSTVMGYRGNKKRDLGVTNLTVLDIPTSYGKNRIEDIIFIPPVISYSRIIIGVSTVNGKMTLAYHGMEGENEVFKKGI